MKKIILILSSAALLSFTAQSFAQTMNFSNLTQTDFEKISKEFSGNFMHHSVMGASSLGTVLGFELGLIAGLQKTPEIDAIVKRTSPDSGVSSLPHAGILGAVGVPFGLSGEIVMIPKISGGGGEYQYTSMGLKWTMNQSLLAVLPFNVALRGIYSNSKFNFTQAVSGVDAKVENSNSVTGLQLLVSPSLPIFEPYAGIGMLNAKNTLSVTGSAGTVFDSTYTSAQSAESTVGSTQYLVGANVRLLVMVLGLEISNAFGATTTTGKFSFAF